MNVRIRIGFTYSYLLQLWKKFSLSVVNLSLISNSLGAPTLLVIYTLWSPQHMHHWIPNTTTSEQHVSWEPAMNYYPYWLQNRIQIPWAPLVRSSLKMDSFCHLWREIFIILDKYFTFIVFIIKLLKHICNTFRPI